ncbi:hypothetical protein [Aeromicrobium sp. REDSEA-S32_B7]|nr:hypothetical protein [Aeromicrobium sp. REDSEA-S32_B7]
MASRTWMDRWAPDGVGEAELRTAPRVDYDPTDSLQADWLAAHDVDASLTPRHLVPSPHDFARAVSLGLGWGLLPAEHAATYGPDLVDLAGPTIRSPLSWQRWRTPSSLLDRLTDVVVATAAERLSPAGR